MDTQEDRPRDDDSRSAPEGETASGVLRRLFRSPPTLLKVLAVILATTVISLEFVPEPWPVAPVFLVGVPLSVWLIGRDRDRS